MKSVRYTPTTCMPVRCTPVMYTPIRYTPMRRLLIQVHARGMCRKHASKMHAVPRRLFLGDCDAPISRYVSR
jgi:hypothetical protein